MVKNQIQKELRLIIWKRRWQQFTKYAAVFALLITSVFGIGGIFISVVVSLSISIMVFQSSSSGIFDSSFLNSPKSGEGIPCSLFSSYRKPPYKTFSHLFNLYVIKHRKIIVLSYFIHV